MQKLFSCALRGSNRFSCSSSTASSASEASRPWRRRFLILARAISIGASGCRIRKGTPSCWARSAIRCRSCWRRKVASTTTAWPARSSCSAISGSRFANNSSLTAEVYGLPLRSERRGMPQRPNMRLRSTSERKRIQPSRSATARLWRDLPSPETPVVIARLQGLGLINCSAHLKYPCRAAPPPSAATLARTRAR